LKDSIQEKDYKLLTKVSMDQDIDDFDVDFLDDPDAFNPNVFDSQDEMDDDFDPEDKMDDFDLDALDVNDVMEL